MRTQEELNELKKECKALDNKLKELTDDELLEVTGGSFSDLWEKMKDIGKKIVNPTGNPPVPPIFPSSLTQENIDWKSDNEVPTMSGEYKL